MSALVGATSKITAIGWYQAPSKKKTTDFNF
jgi:hypothetical protein